MGGSHILSLDIGRKVFTDWFIKYCYSCIFSIWYKIIDFPPLNPATYTIGNAPKILFSRSKEQDESRRLPPLPHILPPIPPIYSEGHYNGNLI